MNRLMLDFETLDVGECPVILSMGAVVFNENGIVDCISEKIDQQSCLDLGCTISERRLRGGKNNQKKPIKLLLVEQPILAMQWECLLDFS
ncbi:hypothetical protein AQ482_10715 [Acinetobacter baumannii]|nr:hypothetical protein AQ482_10715 [Acinetobacter baumannii]